MANILNFKNFNNAGGTTAKETDMVFIPSVEDAMNGVGNAHIVIKDDAVIIRIESKRKTHEWVRKFSSEKEKNKYINEGKIVLKELGFTPK